ncbi:MFS monocarboxylic acid transporter [Tothia fuscella]|uniref:Probable transporter MCH1 n=1 Tax=Tothia fuscella TaxID=1048955 RepID=A0A9P4NYE7_9PEZI|nr:MFS monocarboxylic acid transporter [Tothia fuscella]
MSPPNERIDKLDFPNTGERRSLLHDDRSEHSPGPSHETSRAGSFFEQVVEGIQERDRAAMKDQVVRYGAFACAILACLCCGSITAYSLYGHLFMSHLKYNQSAVNVISIAAEIAMYLPVPAWGYLCDRIGPRIPCILAGVFFGVGYIMAALTYSSGPSKSRGGDGWPFWVMTVSFILIGMGTSCMYLAAITTCAKNFGRGKNKGVALAVPIAAFGLSGMWVSQVGSRMLYEKNADGSRGDVDVYKFFIFLGVTLFAVGMIGGVALKIVDEGEMIEEAIEELEQSGILNEEEYFRRAANQHGYGTIPPHDLSDSTFDFLRTEAEDLKQKEAEEKARKEWLLNGETRRFLSDRTMWWLAAGFFLVTGPGEAFINNLGTVIGTLYPPSARASEIPTSAATHVSIVAITSTLARLFTGTITDMLAPVYAPHQHIRGADSLAASLSSIPLKRFSVSRVYFLLTFGSLLSLGQILLASGLIQNHGDRFWIVSALIGAGYGAVFSLTPIIVSVVWGVENFGTNWGIVAMVPALGACVWGVVYSTVYQAAATGSGSGSPVDGEDVLCYGVRCYAPTFWAMAVSVWAACGLWIWAWKGPGGWYRRGVAV